MEFREHENFRLHEHLHFHPTHSPDYDDLLNGDDDNFLVDLVSFVFNLFT